MPHLFQRSDFPGDPCLPSPSAVCSLPQLLCLEPFLAPLAWLPFPCFPGFGCFLLTPGPNSLLLALLLGPQGLRSCLGILLAWIPLLLVLEAGQGPRSW